VMTVSCGAGSGSQALLSSIAVQVSTTTAVFRQFEKQGLLLTYHFYTVCVSVE